MRLGFVLCTAAFVTTLHNATVHAATQQYARLDECRLEDGQVILDCAVGYRTFGTLNARRDNAVIVQLWFTGRSADWDALQASGLPLVDTHQYFVVVMDPVGNGVSTSPSNSRLQAGDDFPPYTIRDLVAIQHEVATQTLGLNHVKALVGISMGGLQSLQWAASMANFADRVVCISGSPKLTAFDQITWQTYMHALEDRRDSRVAADMQQLLYTTPHHIEASLAPDAVAALLQKSAAAELARFDPTDRLYQVRAMLTHDIGERDMRSEKLLMIVNREDHAIAPGPAMQFAQRVGAQLIVYDSDGGHTAPLTCESKATWAAVGHFLR